MDRLLSEEGMKQAMWDAAQSASQAELDNIQQIDRFRIIATAQDLKTAAVVNAEWVEWLETYLFKESNGWLTFRELPKFALTDWENRKKEIME